MTTQQSWTFTYIFPGGRNSPTEEPSDQCDSIDAQNGEFLGECGVGVSEKYPNQKILAFEAWIFDKEDIQTVVVQLIHPSLNEDKRKQLEAKGELIEIAINKEFILETQTIVAFGYIRDFEFDVDHFNSLIVDLKIYRKPIDEKTSPSWEDIFSAYVGFPLAALVYGSFGGWGLLSIFYLMPLIFINTMTKTWRGKAIYILYFVAWYAFTLFVVYQWIQFGVSHNEYPGLMYPEFLPHFWFK